MSTSEGLELADFERLLELHGARPERWPEELSARARRLLDTSEAARGRWSEARRLEEWLDAAPRAEPSSELMARIASLPARHPRPASSGWWPFGNPLAPLLAWGAAAALGLVVGLAVPELAADDVFASESTSDTTAEDWSEVSELMLGARWALEEE